MDPITDTQTRCDNCGGLYEPAVCRECGLPVGYVHPPLIGSWIHKECRLPPKPGDIVIENNTWMCGRPSILEAETIE